MPLLVFLVFFPFDPLVKESLESESELGIIVIVEFLSRSSYKLKEKTLEIYRQTLIYCRKGFLSEFYKKISTRVVQ